jgi:hypothetical protein
LTKRNLLIFDIPESSLKGVTTTENMFKKRITKFPPVQMRNRSYDLVEDEEQKEDNPQDTKEDMNFNEAIEYKQQ